MLPFWSMVRQKLMATAISAAPETGQGSPPDAARCAVPALPKSPDGTAIVARKPGAGWRMMEEVLTATGLTTEGFQQ